LLRGNRYGAATMHGKTKLLAIAAALCFLAVGPASGVASAANSQQMRMKECNATAAAKKLTGATRKSFMSDCLSDKNPAPSKLTPQQEKMKTCNATATEKKLSGAARNSFMSGCLKK
jgi:psiF repeat